MYNVSDVSASSRLCTGQKAHTKVSNLQKPHQCSDFYPRWTVKQIGRGLHWDFYEEQGKNGFWVIGDGASFESTKSVMEYNTNPETGQPPLVLPTLLRAHEPCPLVFESGLHDLRKLGYNCLIIKVSNVFLPNVEAPATEGPHYSSLCG